MQRVLLAGLSAAAMAMTMTAVNAADVQQQRAMPTKAPVYAAPGYSWTGGYMGMNAGYGWGRSEWLSGGVSSGQFNAGGAVVGGTVGYNVQMGQTVLGLEGDLAWSDMEGRTSNGLCIGVVCETSNSWLGTARGRIGYAFGTLMPFVTGGLAVGDVKATAVGIGSTTAAKAGWALGGGVEAALTGPWTAKVEYLHADLGNGTCDVTICGASTDVEFSTSVVRAGVNYRF